MDTFFGLCDGFGSWFCKRCRCLSGSRHCRRHEDRAWPRVTGQSEDKKTGRIIILLALFFSALEDRGGRWQGVAQCLVWPCHLGIAGTCAEEQFAQHLKEYTEQFQGTLTILDLCNVEN